MLYDITPPITPNMPVWPGDTPLSREVLLDMSKGDNLTLSTLHATVHLGAHADGPNHYGVDGRSIDQQDLKYYLGPCQVIRVAAQRDTRISPEQISTRISTQRVLLSTGTYPDPAVFKEDFAGLATDLVDWLHERDVILVGVDTPSVDLFTSKDLPAHRAILRCDMAILEGLVLADVPEGEYELIALPLPLVGFDASPVRAVLRNPS